MRKRSLRYILITCTLLCSLLIFWVFSTYAGQSEMEAMLLESAAELRSIQKDSAVEVQAFRNEADRDFAEFLTEGWKEMHEMAGLVADSTPKPQVLPKATDKPKDVVVSPDGKKVSISPVIEPEPSLPKPTLSPPPMIQPPSAPLPKPYVAQIPVKPPTLKPTLPLDPDNITLVFYGAPIDINVQEPLRIIPQRPYNNKSLIQAWTHLAQADHAGLLSRLEVLRRELQLNDWGYYQLVKHVARASIKEEQGATVLTWFVLVKSGYRCRIGYGGDELCLLVAVNETIYGVPYFAVDDEKFYNLSRLRTKTKGVGSLTLYGKDHPAATDRFEMQLYQVPLLPVVRVDRPLAFSYAGRSYHVPTSYNRNMVDFYDTYPLTDFPVFFTGSVDPEATATLLAGLQPLVRGKSEAEAVNLILRFVQTAFDYKTDTEQFGREKYFFAPETLAYPFSDCEDRSILFAFFVKKLTGLPVVGLNYPGHMATAVRFSVEIGGDTLLINGHRYTICDPTYINANIGQTMPQFVRLTPIIVLVE